MHPLASTRDRYTNNLFQMPENNKNTNPTTSIKLEAISASNPNSFLQSYSLSANFTIQHIDQYPVIVNIQQRRSLRYYSHNNYECAIEIQAHSLVTVSDSQKSMHNSKQQNCTNHGRLQFLGDKPQHANLTFSLNMLEPRHSLIVNRKYKPSNYQRAITESEYHFQLQHQQASSISAKSIQFHHKSRSP